MLTINLSIPLIAITQSLKQIVKFLLNGRLSLLLIGLVARCLLLGLNLAQPLLVSAVTSYLSGSERPVSQGKGVGLSIAYAMVYVGIAVSNSAHTGLYNALGKLPRLTVAPYCLT